MLNQIKHYIKHIYTFIVEQSIVAQYFTQVSKTENEN